MKLQTEMSEVKSRLGFGAFMLFLVAAEIACAKLAWHTMGEVVSQFLLFLVWFNLVPILFYFLKAKKLAGGLAICGALLIIPPQIFLGFQWYNLHRETLNIVTYVNQAQKRSGSFPKNLATYSYLNPSLRQDIHYRFYSPNDYAVSFHIGSPNTEHWYEAGSGWSYYPD